MGGGGGGGGLKKLLNPLSPEARAVLVEWRTSGDYYRAVAEMVAHDPDLATQ